MRWLFSVSTSLGLSIPKGTATWRSRGLRPCALRRLHAEAIIRTCCRCREARRSCVYPETRIWDAGDSSCVCFARPASESSPPLNSDTLVGAAGGIENRNPCDSAGVGGACRDTNSKDHSSSLSQYRKSLRNPVSSGRSQKSRSRTPTRTMICRCPVFEPL